jgi:hypothetical protein
MTTIEILAMINQKARELSLASDLMYKENNGNSIMGGKLAFASTYLRAVASEIQKIEQKQLAEEAIKRAKEEEEQCPCKGDNACNGCECHDEC